MHIKQFGNINCWVDGSSKINKYSSKFFILYQGLKFIIWCLKFYIHMARELLTLVFSLLQNMLENFQYIIFMIVKLQKCAFLVDSQPISKISTYSNVKQHQQKNKEFSHFSFYQSLNEEILQFILFPIYRGKVGRKKKKEIWKSFWEFFFSCRVCAVFCKCALPADIFFFFSIWCKNDLEKFTKQFCLLMPQHLPELSYGFWIVWLEDEHGKIWFW